LSGSEEIDVDSDVAKLAPEESEDWRYYLNWYLSNGWVGDEAQRLAWRDLIKKYPKLKTSR
jgi:hypothetical protein